MQNFSPEPNNLQNQVILITGAGQGLGQAATYAYAAQGATVILLGKNPNQLAAVYDYIVAQGWPQPAIYPMNLAGASVNHYQELATIILREFGKLDGLLHNAAMLETLTPFEHYPLERWYKLMQVNLNAPFLMTQALLPALKKAPKASIIFTIDRATTAYRGAYGVSKLGLQGLMQILADELETNTNIRVNSICPCATRTALRASAFPAEDPMQHPESQTLMPAYLYLMSDVSQTIHGQTLNLQPNGEWTYDN
jgi:NAD(P)-dependent dehydrogenase (short-subunit alcohol dehydrogenase family)